MKIVKNSAAMSFLLVCLPVLLWAQNSARGYLKAGWRELVKDNDSKALTLFSTAYNISIAQDDTALVAESLLHMGMCTYGTSYTTGLKYATMSLKEYDKLQNSSAAKAAEGRARALQLISTIYSRQGKYKNALALSLQAKGTIAVNDTTATLGLIYTSLGGLYDKLAQSDSANYYYQLALEEHLAKNNKVYLPTAYINKGAALLKNGNSQQALSYFEQAQQIAVSTENKQAQVAAMLALAKWYTEVRNNNTVAESYLTGARKIADSLSDKEFLIRVLAAQIDLDISAKDFQAAFLRQKETNVLEKNNFNLEKERNTALLETQFQVAEKERALKTLHSEQKVTRLTNYFLWSGIVIIVVVGGIVIFILQKINKKDKQLLETQAELKRISEEQQQEKERRLQQNIEAKEHQLSALTLQMYQKNEIMQQLQQELENTNVQNIEVTKIINKGMIQDKEWDNFNVYFESINKNFYAKIKATFPEVSANDLKICALIKLNLSIKEMAGILNISPDSVKTARYRLRKKLQLVTEENLAEFIKNIGD